MPAEIRGRYLRIRIKAPSKFIRGSLRTQDVGRPGGTKRIAGRLKSTGKWATQAWLFELKALKAERPSTWRAYRKVVSGMTRSERDYLRHLMIKASRAGLI